MPSSRRSGTSVQASATAGEGGEAGGEREVAVGDDDLVDAGGGEVVDPGVHGGVEPAARDGDDTWRRAPAAHAATSSSSVTTVTGSGAAAASTCVAMRAGQVGPAAGVEDLGQPALGCRERP